MTREEAKKYRAAIEQAAQYLDETTALECPSLFPTWKEGTTYEAGTKIQYDGVVYTILQEHTSQSDWTPAVTSSLFAQVLVSEDGTPLEWVQPGSTNPYMKGDRVIYNGLVYESLIDNNVWSPDAYPAGWQVINE